VGRRSRQLLAPAAVTDAAAVAAAAGPAAGGAAATSVFCENVADSRQKKYGERKIREIIHTNQNMEVFALLQSKNWKICKIISESCMYN
jgi:hypothetical protein